MDGPDGGGIQITESRVGNALLATIGLLLTAQAVRFPSDGVVDHSQILLAAVVLGIAAQTVGNILRTVRPWRIVVRADGLQVEEMRALLDGGGETIPWEELSGARVVSRRFGRGRSGARIQSIRLTGADGTRRLTLRGRYRLEHTRWRFSGRQDVADLLDARIRAATGQPPHFTPAGPPGPERGGWPKRRGSQLALTLFMLTCLTIIATILLAYR